MKLKNLSEGQLERLGWVALITISATPIISGVSEFFARISAIVALALMGYYLAKKKMYSPIVLVGGIILLALTRYVILK